MVMVAILLDDGAVECRDGGYALQPPLLAAHPSSAQAPRPLSDEVLTLVDDHGVTSPGHDEDGTCNGEWNGELMCCNPYI